MQRVSIGRAIVREPRAFLMDEPLSNLDAKLREALRAELKDLQMKLGATFLFVTHDQIEAMSMGDKIGVLNAGRIVQVGTPHEIYNRPRDVFVAGFVGSPPMNLAGRRVARRARRRPARASSTSALDGPIRARPAAGAARSRSASARRTSRVGPNGAASRRASTTSRTTASSRS